LIPDKGKKKDITKGTTKISVKLTHQTCHVSSDQQEGEKQAPPPIKEQMGCTCTNMIGEGPNGKHSKDLMPKSKLGVAKGAEGAKREIEKPLEPSRIFFKKA